jgi:hypothetical protein|tara:strand:- start:440 stop:826 length:387 start_codon:yes stop_codon:yes gene_type:complete
MLAWLLIICIVFFLLYSDIDITGNRIIVLGYKTKYFYISDGQSKKMFEKMKKDGMPEESLKQFITMEDRFLSLERKSVCSQISRKFEAFALSDEIKNQFLGYDFSYHAKHLKQISEPEKLINRNISCS